MGVGPRPGYLDNNRNYDTREPERKELSFETRIEGKETVMPNNGLNLTRADKPPSQANPTVGHA